MTAWTAQIEAQPLEAVVGLRMRPEENTEESRKRAKAGTMSTADVFWRTAPAAGMLGTVSLEHSLAFHRLQEAREELHRARSGFSSLSPQQRAKMVAYFEANLVKAAEWLARTSASEKIVPPLAP